LPGVIGDDDELIAGRVGSDDSPVLREFIDEMTRINKGRAFYTRPDQLGEYLLVDYVARKRKKVYR